MHKELANLYGHLFTHVLRPDFRVSHLTRKYRRLSARISRRMRSLSLYSFKCELKRVSKNMGLIVITVDESYKTKVSEKRKNEKKTVYVRFELKNPVHPPNQINAGQFTRIQLLLSKCLKIGKNVFRLDYEIGLK